MWRHIVSVLRRLGQRSNPHPTSGVGSEPPRDADEQPTPADVAPQADAAEGRDTVLDQLVEDWLNAPLIYEQRRMLEAHPELLAPAVEAILIEAVEQYRKEPEMAQELRERLRLLGAVRQAGRDARAITEVYVNLEGGFAVDTPPWLDDLELQLAHIAHTESAHIAAARRVDMWRQALIRLHEEHDIPDVIIAEANARLWDALDDLPHPSLVEQEEGLTCLWNALAVYTLDRYPAQYARCQLYMGTSYQERASGSPRENFEAALACYREALGVYRPETFPELYALTENNRGNTYHRRIAGSRRDNAEEAIACYQRALTIYTLEDYPNDYAMTQNNLGNTYLIRMTGRRSDNLETAITCYHEALPVYTRDDAPRDYAMLQVGLGTVYRERVEGLEADNLEAAIGYYEAALQVYDAKKDPLRYAQVQVNLGGAYQERLLGARNENLETALACFQRALTIYTRDGQPSAYARTRMGMGNLFRVRVSGERSGNLDDAIRAYEDALAIFTPEDYPRDHRNVACALAATLWREIAPLAEQRGQWDEARQTYERAHTLYLSARQVQAELGWLETDEQGRARLRGSTGGAREMYARDAWILWRLEDAPGAVVALEAGRAQALAEAQAIADLATDRLCAEHAEAIADASAAYQAARQTEDRRELRQARDQLKDIRTAIHAHCDSQFLPDEPTIGVIEQAAASGHALIYLAATDRGGLLGIASPVAPTTAADYGAPRISIHFVAIPDLTADSVDSWLIRPDTADVRGVILGGLQVALNREGRRVLQTWGELASTEEGGARGRLALPLKEVATRLPANRDTVRRALERALDQCHMAANRAEREDQIMRARTWRNRAAKSLGAALQERWFRSMFDWAFQAAELDIVLPALSQTIMQPLRESLDHLDLATYPVALIPCGLLGAFPLHAAPVSVTLASGQDVEIPFQETCALTYQASAAAFTAARRAVETLPEHGPVIMVGDPRPTVLPTLPWAQAEAQAIVQVATNARIAGSRAMLAEDATRDGVMAMLARIRDSGRGAWVGVASHGHADPTDPHRCFMVLAASERLTLADMQRQRLLAGVRLFNASGCVTGLGDLETAPDELSSFAGGALQAGAAGVFATQWAVNDRATALLMLRFAHEWVGAGAQSSLAPTVALRAAVSWLRQATPSEINAFTRSAWDTAGSELEFARAMEPDDDDVITTVRGLDLRDALAVETGVPLAGAAATNDADDSDDASIRARRRLPAPTSAPDTSDNVESAAPYAHPIYWAAVVAYGA